MLTGYVVFVKKHLLLSAFIQFALLGTLGEFVGIWVAKKRFINPFSLGQVFLKMLGWGFLGIIIKYAFTGFVGFTRELIDHGLLGKIFTTKLLFAFSVSFFMNILFGPHLMFLHRFIDNLILHTNTYEGIKNSLLTLIWFWIPAHTFTFMLPVEFRIGVAALWSIVLGVIMGYFKRLKQG